jgi:hypothetical protein
MASQFSKLNSSLEASDLKRHFGRDADHSQVFCLPSHQRVGLQVFQYLLALPLGFRYASVLDQFMIAPRLYLIQRETFFRSLSMAPVYT